MRRERKTLPAWKAGLILLGGVFLLFYIQSKNLGFGLAPQDVMEHIESIAPEYDLDANFIFAVALAETRLNPDAEKRDRRGIMLISRNNWERTTHLPFDEAFDWKTNISVTTKYLDYLRALLKQGNHFNYPLLAASYLYGYRVIQDNSYDISKLPHPGNPIYAQLFRGEF